MERKNNSSANRRKAKVIVGSVAIAFLLLFTALGISGYFSVGEWLIADLVVAVLANMALRMINRKNNQYN